MFVGNSLKYSWSFPLTFKDLSLDNFFCPVFAILAISRLTFRKSSQRRIASSEFSNRPLSKAYCSSQDHYGINTSTGESEWSTLVDHRYSHITSFNEAYFSTISYGNNAYSDSATINLCNIYTGDCREIIKYYKEGDFEPHLHGPVAVINSNNDTLVIYQNREYAYLTSNEIRGNYHCYNMTQKVMEWEHLDAEIWDNANIRAPLIDGDYCYFVGLASAYCFNIHTGEKIWQYDHDVAW